MSSDEMLLQMHDTRRCRHRRRSHRRRGGGTKSQLVLDILHQKKRPRLVAYYFQSLIFHACDFSRPTSPSSRRFAFYGVYCSLSTPAKRLIDGLTTVRRHSRLYLVQATLAGRGGRARKHVPPTMLIRLFSGQYRVVKFVYWISV